MVEISLDSRNRAGWLLQVAGSFSRTALSSQA